MTSGLLPAWGWCPPVLFVQINLRQVLSKKINQSIKKMDLVKSQSQDRIKTRVGT